MTFRVTPQYDSLQNRYYLPITEERKSRNNLPSLVEATSKTSFRFCDAIEMFTETEEEFNTRIMLEEIYRSPEVTKPWYWDSTNNALANEQDMVDECAHIQEGGCIKRETLAQRVTKLFCEIYGFDASTRYSAKFIKSTILNYLPNNAFMVAVSLECNGANLWEALESAMWWHRDYKAEAGNCKSTARASAR